MLASPNSSTELMAIKSANGIGAPSVDDALRLDAPSEYSSASDQTAERAETIKLIPETWSRPIVTTILVE
ncbi:hypothetical protein GCM10009613_15320 [Pseudonocardia kongjuensis]|uniref:Uncharacterized protein n=1 Tax=Pseudonocardia kongjuensis TaxID=102227 RepID=A0ABN1XL00_9PSEU